MTTVALAIAAGLIIGVALGALGGGGSILAVPVLAFVIGQDPSQATTGALVVVGATAAVGAVSAYRRGHLLLGRGIGFGLVASLGAVVGGSASAAIDEQILLGAFALLMFVVGALMLIRQRRRFLSPAAERAERPLIDDPIITFSPTFACACPRAFKLAITATVVGILTGLLGVGGGFLIVPALLLALNLPQRYAAGTALVVITMTSSVALITRLNTAMPTPEWTPVLALTGVSVLAAIGAGRIAARINSDSLTTAFAGLTLVVALFTGSQAVAGLS